MRMTQRRSSKGSWLFGTVRNLGLCCVLLFAGHASAAPSAQDRERARTLMDLGDARFEAKAYAAALEQYRAADQLMGVPTTGIEVGRTLERLGRLLEAREVLRLVSEFPQRADEPRPFSSARQRADRLLGDIAPRIPRVTLEVSGLSQGVTPNVSWDGRAVDAAKLGGYLETDPGAHQVVASAPGFATIKREVKLAEGQALNVVLTFTTTPVAAMTRQASAKAGPAPVPLASPSAGKSALFWTGIGVAVVGVATGSVTGLRSLSLTSSAKQHCDGTRCRADAQPSIDDAKLFANVANVSFGVGLAGLGLATWQFFMPRSAKETDKSRPRAHIEAGLALDGVAVRGSF
jgi:hypothetical protein